MQTPWLQRLTRDSAVNVLHWIIPKGTLWKNTLASDVILLGGSIPHVTCRPALSPRHVVLRRPVLVISHRHFHMASCVLLMLLNYLEQLLVLRDTSRSCLRCRNDSLLIINRPMMMITWPGVATASAHGCGIRITLAHQPIIDRLITLRRSSILQLALRRPLGDDLHQLAVARHI